MTGLRNAVAGETAKGGIAVRVERDYRQLR